MIIGYRISSNSSDTSVEEGGRAVEFWVDKQGKWVWKTEYRTFGEMISLMLFL